MNLITLQTLEPAQIAEIIDTSIRIKQRPQHYSEVLKHKKLYMLFEKTSTRTVLGLGLAFNELGGIHIFQRWQESNFVVGEIQDETRYVACNVDVILARLKQHADIARMGESSPVPVINGCCNRYHPTQALADCMTVKELFGTYQKTLLYIGIWNNVFNSLVHALPRLGGKLVGVCPTINEATLAKADVPAVVEHTENLEFYDGADMSPDQLRALVCQADVVYTDTWVDMEFFNNPEFAALKDERINLMRPFALTPDLLAGSTARVLHDMPMHPGYEIERDVIEAHLDTILQQADNRRHVAKGIFLHLLGVTV
jgi:ornithine carbamoyltransferase